MDRRRKYAQLPEVLAKRGLKPAEIEAVLGADYIRVLRQTMPV